MALTRENIKECEEATMARFMEGLHPRIRDIVELHDHVSMDSLLHQCQRVESQLQRQDRDSYYHSRSSKSYSHAYGKSSSKGGFDKGFKRV